RARVEVVRPSTRGRQGHPRRPAAGGVLGLKDGHAAAGAGQIHGCGQACEAGADDHDVIRGRAALGSPGRWTAHAERAVETSMRESSAARPSPVSSLVEYRAARAEEPSSRIIFSMRSGAPLEVI